MAYTLHYDFQEYVGDGELWAVNYQYPVQESIDDIMHYLYEKKFGRDFAEISWYLEPGAKEAMGEWEQAYLKDEIKFYDYYSSLNYEFTDWLIDEYRDAALAECLDKISATEFGVTAYPCIV